MSETAEKETTVQCGHYYAVGSGQVAGLGLINAVTDDASRPGRSNRPARTHLLAHSPLLSRINTTRAVPTGGKRYDAHALPH